MAFVASHPSSSTPCHTPRPSKPARTRDPGQDPPIPPTPSPTYERLREYIAKRMRMSHIYQPLMLMELLGRRSPAPAQDVARRNLGEDVTQIDYYTERVKRLVGKVHLQRHHPLRARRLRPGGRRPRSRVRSAAASTGEPGGRAGRSPGFQGPPL